MTPRTSIVPEANPPPSMRGFTCIACQVIFRTSDLQRSHMKGDWHRYNVKRRMTTLPPISAEDFARLVEDARPTAAAAYERPCQVCQKTFNSENAFRNHISSQKHKASEKAALMRSRQGRVTARASAAARDYDEASSVISSTFSLGRPHLTAAAPTDSDSDIVDTDAEREFTHVVEGLKNATIDGPSPVRRPGNPRLSVIGQRQSDHPLSRATNGHKEDKEEEEGSDDADEEDTASRASTPTAVRSPAHQKSRLKSAEASLNRCLFCNLDSPSVKLNTKHMQVTHGMVIPEEEYLVDLEGLLGFLQTRIRRAYECITCGKRKSNVFAVQTHMRDKSHCMIPYMTLGEKALIGDFYDFRSTYSDAEDDSDDSDDEAPAPSSGGAKLGAKRTVETTEMDVDGNDDDEGGWETEDSESAYDEDEDEDDQLTDLENAVYYDDFELHLPSGRRVGHRAHNRYYRQNLRNHPSEQEREMLNAANAIENGPADGSGDGSSETALAARASQSAVTQTPRNLRGLAGVDDRARLQVRTKERKTQKMQQVAEGKQKTKTVAKKIGTNFKFRGRGGGL